MNVDVLIIGEFRTLKLCFQSLKNILNNDTYRYFLYTPNDDQVDLNFCNTNSITHTNVVLDIQVPNKYPINPSIGVNNPIGIMNQLCLVYKSIKLHLENHNPDIIFRTRPDILFENKVLDNTILNNTLYVPNFHEFWGYNDRFAYGYSNVMEYYANRYLVLDKYISEGMNFHPETSLKYHFDKSTFCVIKNDVRFNRWRTDGTIKNDY